VTPEREHLSGWQEAVSVVEAGRQAMLHCPGCGAAWSESQRIEANRQGRLLHRGQEIDAQGVIQGEPPGTHTLGFRFSATNNLLLSMSRVAEEEWQAPRTTEPELAEKKLRQFYWSLPSLGEAITLSELDVQRIIARSIDLPRGRVPADAAAITVGIDIGKWLCHWLALAWRPGATPHVLEYGKLEVPSQTMAEELAILTALRRFRDEIAAPGWPALAGGLQVIPRLVLVDSGHWESVVVSFCAESGAGYLPAKGFGVQQLGRRAIQQEPGYERLRQPGGHVLVEINADHWKSYVHARLQTPVNQPGGLTLFHGSSPEHLTLARHLTAEKQVEEFIAGRGLVSRWEALSRNNHFLDALALACVAGHGLGQRMLQIVPPPPNAAATEPTLPLDWPSRYRGKW
jgi:phage terminase large subunit GpA-like protein